MFIFTAKIKHGKVVLGALGLAAVCTAGLLLFGLPGKQTAAANSTLPSPKGIKTAEDRIAYLESYGWLIEPEPIAVEELLIPEEFDETYQDYLNLQTDQGFDLTKYCGKRVKRYSYKIQNYPGGESGVQAALLIYRNTVIGGEVLSSNSGGFIHGLRFPDQ